MTDDLFARLQVMVRALLDFEEAAPRTEDEVEEIVQSVAPMAMGDEKLLDRLRRYIEEQVVVTAAEASTLEDQHQPWLSSRRADFNWLFWERYRRHLVEQKGLPKNVVDRLDETTDHILDHLEDPGKETPWDRRGLIVGQVQSGKTANYLGLIAKAIDVGYRVIVVLAGADNDLRAQTQIRLEEGIIGWDTSGKKVDINNPTAQRVGVGRLKGRQLVVNPVTTRDGAGDFKAAQAQVLKQIGSDPMILVVKKNKSVLQNVFKSLTSVSADVGPDDRKTIKNHPILLIDDEADHYSVNTAKDDPEADPTAINGLVRKILACFEQSAYVGYTATAFANIFIALDDGSEEHGDTLFPRDFMISVKPPSNYVGAQRVFGLSDPSLGDVREGLPIVRRIADSEDWLPSKHKNGTDPGDFLPDSLEDAINSFLLTIAARRARGQTTAHNSMLVHVTRFNNVQDRVSQLVFGHVRNLRTRLRQGDDGKTMAKLRDLWESDHRKTTKKMAELDEFGKLTRVTWKTVEREIRHAVESVEIRTINGMAKEVLDYVEHQETGLNVIAIGGNKLSRGLTLEGLSVSYYLRTSRAYDTLLQMGRWFGYRQGYADLCRLYTTSQLEGWYRDITAANAELLRDLDMMAIAGGTPKEFGLKVRTHADGLMVSSPNKVRTGQKITLSFANQTKTQGAYARNPEKKRRALAALEQLLERIGSAPDESDDNRGGRLIFEGVPGQTVAEFLRSYPTNPEARLTRTDLMADYVDDRLAQDELRDWRVVVFSPNSATRHREVAGLKIGYAERASDKRNTPESDDQPRTTESQYMIKAFIGSDDQDEGLSLAQKAAAEQEREVYPKLTKNDAWRRQRTTPVMFLALLDPAYIQKEVASPADEGDDPDPYVALALIFPDTEHPTGGREYLIGEVYRQMELGWEDDA